MTRLELRNGSFVDLHLALEEGRTRVEMPEWPLTLFDALTEPVPPTGKSDTPTGP